MIPESLALRSRLLTCTLDLFLAYQKQRCYRHFQQVTYDFLFIFCIQDLYALKRKAISKRQSLKHAFAIRTSTDENEIPMVQHQNVDRGRQGCGIMGDFYFLLCAVLNFKKYLLIQYYIVLYNIYYYIICIAFVVRSYKDCLQEFQSSINFPLTSFHALILKTSGIKLRELKKEELERKRNFPISPLLSTWQNLARASDSYKD